MDYWKLFGGTFVLIFLAELGDKTQLAAMAKTADSPGSSAKWVVFLAASLALALSTFIAVFLGHILKSLVPDERYIKLAAAVLFLVFGFGLLYEMYASFAGDRKKAAPAGSEAAPSEPGFAGGLALRAAMEFESLAVTRYRGLAEKAKPALAALLRDLADEEERHLERLRTIPVEELPAAARKKPRGGAGLSGRQLTLEGDDAAILGDLVAHEEATAAFYRDLADRTLIGSVKAVLGNLALEEAEHARRLREEMG